MAVCRWCEDKWQNRLNYRTSARGVLALRCLRLVL